jgi:hypothetical protein
LDGLLAGIVEAHGGMDRWNGYEKIDATIVSGGGADRLITLQRC